MADLRQVASNRSFGGTQKVYEADSETLGCATRFGVYFPPGTDAGACDRPVLYYLSGLTCTEQNVLTKAGAQRACAEHGIVLVAPDTSPRGDDVADDEAWDLGQGAGFYLTATREPWAKHYRMDRFVTHELVQWVAQLTTSVARGVTGHSMGGHGAIVLALRSPGLYRSVSAFAPILEPSHVPWGQKAFTAYLGDDRDVWAAWDASQLVRDADERLPMRIDQGDADGFLAEQLTSDRFLAACRAADHPVDYRLQPGYDHSYYFVASFIGDHVAWHAAALGRG